MFFVILLTFLIAAPGPAAASASSRVTPDQYKTFTFPRTPEISEDELLIKDFSTFVHKHSVGAPGGNETRRFVPPALEPAVLTPYKYHSMMFDIMKQSMYAAQDRLKYLQGILDKYEDDRCFRAGYVFAKLDQLLDDMKRIYSYAVKKHDWRTVKQNIIFYKHLTKKNIDITYMVEFLFDFHDRNIKAIEKIFNQIPKE